MIVPYSHDTWSWSHTWSQSHTHTIPGPSPIHTIPGPSPILTRYLVPVPYSHDTWSQSHTHMILGSVILSGPLEHKPGRLHTFSVSAKLHVMYIHLQRTCEGKSWRYTDEDPVRPLLPLLSPPSFTSSPSPPSSYQFSETFHMLHVGIPYDEYLEWS